MLVSTLMAFAAKYDIAISAGRVLSAELGFIAQKLGDFFEAETKKKPGTVDKLFSVRDPSWMLPRAEYARLLQLLRS